MGTDGKHSTNIERCSGIWYNKNNPEFTISFGIDEGRFEMGRINQVEQDVYWMNRLVGKIHNSYVYNLNIDYHSTVLFSTLAVFADGFKFQRVLWKSNMLFQNISKVGEHLFLGLKVGVIDKIKTYILENDLHEASQ